MRNKSARLKSQVGLTRGLISFALGSIALLFIFEVIFFLRLIFPGIFYGFLDSVWLWLVVLLPVLGLFFGAIGLKSHGKYLAIIGMVICAIDLNTILFMLLYYQGFPWWL